MSVFVLFLLANLFIVGGQSIVVSEAGAAASAPAGKVGVAVGVHVAF